MNQNSKTFCAIHNLTCFKQCARCILNESKPLTIQDQIENKLNAIEKQKQEAKELRWRTRGTLGELTEKYINEGSSEDDAYNQARQECGL